MNSNRISMVEECIKRGNTHHAQKKFNAAIADYSKAIEINPDYADAYKNRANAYAIIRQSHAQMVHGTESFLKVDSRLRGNDIIYGVIPAKAGIHNKTNFKEKLDYLAGPQPNKIALLYTLFG